MTLRTDHDHPRPQRLGHDPPEETGQIDLGEIVDLECFFASVLSDCEGEAEDAGVEDENVDLGVGADHLCGERTDGPANNKSLSKPYELKKSK